MNTYSSKIGLSVVEAGWLLQMTEARVRGMLRRGELSYVVEGRRIDPVGVRARLGGDCARLLLDRVLSGEIRAPRPEYRHGAPAPMYPGTLDLVINTGIFVSEQEIPAVMDALARELGSALVLDPASVDIERTVR